MKTVFLGRQHYRSTLALQEAIFALKSSRRKLARGAKPAGSGESAYSAAPPPPVPDTLLLVEHAASIYTMGKRDTSGGIRDEAVDVVKIRRGGGLTWHGPGQLTMYPIVDVMRAFNNCQLPVEKKGKSPLRWYTEVLENTMIATAAEFGVNAHPGLVGVWVDQDAVDAKGQPEVKKIGSIGLQVSDWVSMHGVGFNVCNDLSLFNPIVMCELPDKAPTSLQVEIARLTTAASSPNPNLAMANVAGKMARNFVAALQPKEAIQLDWMTDESYLRRHVLQ